MDKETLLQMLDACRAGSSDLEQPEMEPLRRLIQETPEWRSAWESRQAWDRCMQQLCHDVAVPEGLEARLLESLVAPPASDRLPETRPCSPPTVTPAPTSPRSRSRRWWLGAAVVAASLAIVGSASQLFWKSEVSGSQLANDAVRWLDSDINAQGWSTDWDVLQDTSRPMSRQLNATRNAWQQLRVPLDDQCIAYRLKDPRFPHAPVLFVMRTKTQITPMTDRPPQQPDVDSGGVFCGVWREQDCLCALVVPGNRREYQNLTHAARQVAQRLVSPRFLAF